MPRHSAANSGKFTGNRNRLPTQPAEEPVQRLRRHNFVPPWPTEAPVQRLRKRRKDCEQSWTFRGARANSVVPPPRLLHEGASAGKEGGARDR